MLDRPASGRAFFETVIAENLDVGRPDRVSLIFDRRIRNAVTPAHPVPLPDPGVHPRRHPVLARRVQAHPDQAVSQGRKSPSDRDHHQRHPGLRDRQTTVQPARLREVGFSANRRLLDAQTISHDPIIGDTVFNHDQPARRHRRPNESPGCASGTPAVHALLAAIAIFRLQPDGFANRHLRKHLAPLLGADPPSTSAPGG